MGPDRGDAPDPPESPDEAVGVFPQGWALKGALMGESRNEDKMG